MKLEDINNSEIKIETARLILRPWELSDTDDLYEYASVAGVGEAAGWKHHETKEQSEAVIKNFIAQHRCFAIEEKESGKVIGSVSLESTPYDIFKDADIGENVNEVGYVIAKNYWGKGYATEAVRGILSYCFYMLHLDAVTCGHFKGNAASRAVIKKCGFTYVGDGKYTMEGGRTYDSQHYVLTHSEYGIEYKA